MHGEEPLLAGRDLVAELVCTTQVAIGADIRLDAWVQTNGVGLSHSYLRLFNDLDIHVGVSLDGGPEEQDRHRRFANGRGSYAAVAAGLDRLTQAPFKHRFSGLLCTIDLRNDPVATYEALAAFDPPRIDFLLPYGTWASPPPGHLPEVADTPYADWLIEIFDHWYYAAGAGIRLFEDIMLLLLDGDAPSEVLGLSPTRIAVIETDGAVEPADNLKVAYHGAGMTGLDVTTNSLDEALLRPGVVARQLGERSLCSRCRACDIRRICGAGLYAHRYRPGSGFYNPSVYCPDLIKLIGHIRETLRADITERQRKQASE